MSLRSPLTQPPPWTHTTAGNGPSPLAGMTRSSWRLAPPPVPNTMFGISWTVGGSAATTAGNAKPTQTPRTTYRMGTSVSGEPAGSSRRDKPGGSPGDFRLPHYGDRLVKIQYGSRRDPAE